MVYLRRWMCVGLGFAFVCGCGSPAAPPVSSGELAPAGIEATPADAAAAVMAAAKAMRDGKIEAAYDLLPASYQKDIDGLVHDFAGRMDREVWETGFSTIGKAAGLLKAKKELLLSMVPKQPGNESQTEQLIANWDGLASGLEQFAASDLSRIEKLESAPARDLLKSGIGPMAKVVVSMATVRTQDGAATLADLDKVKAEVVSTTESTASVKITSPNKPEPETVEFAKVEGKWIPKSLADDWASHMEKAREQLKAVDADTITANKPQILQVLKTVDGVLDEMKKAETPEQIQQAAFPLILQAMMMQGQMGGGAKPKPEPTAAQVTITVGHVLTDEDQTKLTALLKTLVDESAALSTSFALVDDKTIITVSPVDDVAEFAKKLSIAKEVEVDEDARTISVGKIEFE